MAKLAISAVGLVKWFGEGETKTFAVKDASLDAYFGEIVFLVGPSGSGTYNCRKRRNSANFKTK